jgi:hypothetical protein
MLTPTSLQKRLKQRNRAYVANRAAAHLRCSAQREMMTDYKKLVPEISEWDNGQGVSISDWIQMTGDYAHAVGYSVVFWPSFVEREGFIFREDVKNIDRWVKAYNGDRKTIESTANHIHLTDLHCNDMQGNTPERIQYLASVLKAFYTCKLKRDFPDRLFCVEVSGEPKAPILTFYQEKETGSESQEGIGEKHAKPSE